MSSYGELEIEHPGLFCPNCGEVLERNAFEGGRRLARCWHCGGMVRAAIRPRSSRTATGEWNERVTPRTRLEPASWYAPPSLQCPYCEHVNRENPSQTESSKVYCVNCGAALKMACLNCERPMYVLDHFCPYCRTDQERAQYELEVYCWQQFNEGKRLARLGRWDDAHSCLRIFFDPQAAGDDEPRTKYARTVYLNSIAMEDGGEGLRIFNETLEHLRRQANEQLRRDERSRLVKWGVVVALIGALGLWSALTLGSWWAIFAIGIAAIVLVGFLVLFILASIGGM